VVEAGEADGLLDAADCACLLARCGWGCVTDGREEGEERCLGEWPNARRFGRHDVVDI